MKKNIHPPYHPVCFIDISTNKHFLTNSTLSSKTKETIDGVEYPVIKRDVTSDSHPAYTHQKQFISSAGRAEKFNKKFKLHARS